MKNETPNGFIFSATWRCATECQPPTTSVPLSAFHYFLLILIRPCPCKFTPTTHFISNMAPANLDVFAAANAAYAASFTEGGLPMPPARK
jgi:hypothetical protein